MWRRVPESAALLLLLAAAAATPAAIQSQFDSVAAGAEAPGPIDVLGYRIDLRLEPEARSLSASAEITLRVVDADVATLPLDLVDMIVDSVKVDGAAAPFSRHETGLEVRPGRAASPGDTLVVEIFYHGSPSDGLYFQPDAYGRPTIFADNWPDRARHWFPAVDHPRDKAAVEFRVRAPEEWKVIGVGRLVSESGVGDGERVTIWATERPLPVYTMVVGAAVLAVRELGALGCTADAGRCVPIAQWVFPEDEERALRLFRRAPEMVAFYDSLIGPFPYEKLALVQSSTRFGGMENSSAIFFAEGVVRHSASDVIVAHEVAHQWFGDAVTEADWAHLWLSEGFATYFASVFYELADGATAADELRAVSEQRYLASGEVARPIIEPLPADLFRLLNSNHYQKGAWVLHMLRRVVGDEAFFAGIRRYYATHAHGTALSADLRRAMEEESGIELGWFFEQWLERPGYPQVEARTKWDGEAGVLSLELVQTQPWPPFRFPLDIEANGEGYRLHKTVWVERGEERVAWQLPGEPLGVVVDPSNRLLGTTKLVR